MIRKEREEEKVINTSGFKVQLVKHLKKYGE
jgi:hypothetical protein